MIQAHPITTTGGAEANATVAAQHAPVCDFASAPVSTSASARLSAHAAFTAQTVVESRLGPLLLARTASGLGGVWFAGQKHHPPALAAPHNADDPLLARAADQLQRFFAGEADAFDLPLDLHGTAFQRSVWAALLAIPRGATRSYGAIAAAIGAAGAVRAVGSAIGRNPVSVIVPCHRVVGSDGSLTGYAGGIDRKRALLELEKADLATICRSSRPVPATPPERSSTCLSPTCPRPTGLSSIRLT